MKRFFLLLPLAVAAVAQTEPAARDIAGRLSAGALKADVSFLASDALQGRATPSKSLDIAAEFIASQFRRAGLAPGGDTGYFQTANLTCVKPNTQGLELTFVIGGKAIKAAADSIWVQQPGLAATDLAAVPAIRANPPELLALKPEDVRGKALIVDSLAEYTGPAALVVQMLSPKDAALITEGSGSPVLDASAPAPPPALLVSDPSVRKALAAAPRAEVTISARIPAPSVEPVTLRNVIGILPGADPTLGKTYLVLSAHYDHLGIRAGGKGDRIFNGANDDASGTASLIEIANALARMPGKPRRTIVFLAVFGEELGEIGSRYYVRHPAFPLSKTIADINLEQLGRTDSDEGSRRLEFNLTGFDFTTLAPVFEKAAQDAGVKAVDDVANGDAFFDRSDNLAFAEAGIPSTTASVTYFFPDYHGVGDEWPKLDYSNMARIDCALALAVFRVANATEAPAWNPAKARAVRYSQLKRGIRE